MNQICDVFRDKRRHPTASLAMLVAQGEEPFDSGPDPADAIDACAQRALVASVLDILRATDPLGTRLFELRHFDGLTPEAIAAKVEMPVEHVWTKLHRFGKRSFKTMRYFIEHAKRCQEPFTEKVPDTFLTPFLRPATCWTVP